MFFTTANPSTLRRTTFVPVGRSLERLLEESQRLNRQKPVAVTQDDKTYTLSVDLPGVTKEQLSIGIEGSMVRIETRDGAPRRYQAAYELPQDVDPAGSQARLENGVLTLKLTKQVPASRVKELIIH